MVKASLKKRKPPARLRYEASHPVVTLRLPLETHGRLKAALAALGCTAATWVKHHLDQDNARAREEAKVLARERDGLGRELQGLEKRIAAAERKLAELERKGEARRKEIEAPIEAERARILEEARKRADRMVKEHELWLSLGPGKVAELKTQVKEAEERLRQINRQVEEGRAALKQIEERGEALLAPLAEKAMELARQKGVPAAVCLSCPGYAGLISMASMVEAVAGEVPPASGAVEQGPPPQGRQPSPPQPPTAAAPGQA